MNLCFHLQPSSSEENSPALSEKTTSDSAHHSSPLTTHKTPPIAPRPRPKPKPRKSGADIKVQYYSYALSPLTHTHTHTHTLKEEVKEDGEKTSPKQATPTVSPDLPGEKGESGEGVKGEEGEGDKESPLEGQEIEC